MTNAITDRQVGESIGWRFSETPHSKSNPSTPYWDNDGGYEISVRNFKPTTDKDEALYALEMSGISAMEICEFIVAGGITDEDEYGYNHVPFEKVGTFKIQRK